MFTRILFNPVVLGVLLSPLVFILLQFLKAGFSALDKAPAWAKQITAMALGLALVGLVSLVPGVGPALAACATVSDTGITDACRDALLNSKTISAILAGILPQLFHIAQKLSDAPPSHDPGA